MKKNPLILTVSFQLENVPFNIKSYRFDYDTSFCFWVFEKRLTQENCFLFCKKYEKKSIILTVSFQLKNVPFNIQSYRFERNDAMNFHRQLWLIVLLLGIREKVNTGG